MNFLGIDYGEAKIGLAISAGELAQPLGVIKTENGQEKISQICEKQEIEKIIVGVSEGKIGERAKNFGDSLGQITGLPVIFWTEALTSSLAREKMIEAQKGRRKRKLDEHAVAAAIILQDFLDNQEMPKED
jgi:putative Holliday junction resolvase